MDIICDASRGYQYRIDNARSLSTDRIKQWLLNSFAVNNVLQGSRRLSERIVYEDIPSGNDCLLEVVKAMQEDKVINVEYDNFFESTPKQLLIEPYCVKVFRQRWYVVGKAKGEKVIWHWALDRFLSLEITDKKFRLPKNFSADISVRSCCLMVKRLRCCCLSMCVTIWQRESGRVWRTIVII